MRLIHEMITDFVNKSKGLIPQKAPSSVWHVESWAHLIISSGGGRGKGGRRSWNTAGMGLWDHREDTNPRREDASPCKHLSVTDRDSPLLHTPAPHTYSTAFFYAVNISVCLAKT